MEETDRVLSFDFERGLVGNVQANTQERRQVVATVGTASFGQAGIEGAVPGTRKNIRQTVCRHWLRGLCMKGDACCFLHQLDHDRMPICRFYARYGECREPDCIFKHSNEDAKECYMYMLGFCPNGPDCRYKHVKSSGPLPSLEETYQKIQQRLAMAYYGTQSNRYLAQRHGMSSLQVDAKDFKSSQVGAMANGSAVESVPEVSPSLLLHLKEAKETQVASSVQASPPLLAGLPTTQMPPFLSASTPLPEGTSRFFIVKSCSRENLHLSVMRGMWATHRNNEAKLNDAFDSCDNVILVFSVNETGHFQGCARMVSKIGVISGGGNWKYADGNARFGNNFLLKWLKLCELSFHKTRHLRNSYNDNLPVKISRDCQELEPTVGEQLASLLYTEPDSDLMKFAIEAEVKRKEEASIGANSVDDLDNAVENQFKEVDRKDGEQSEEDDGPMPIMYHSIGSRKRIRPSSSALLPSFELGNLSRRREFMNNTYSMGYDNIIRNPANCFGLPGAPLGQVFPPFFPLQTYGGHLYSSVGPRSALGYTPIEVSSGVPYPVLTSRTDLYSQAQVNAMGPHSPLLTGSKPKRSAVISRTTSGTSKLAKLLSRIAQNNGNTGARRISTKDPQRIRNERIAAKLRNTAKQLRSAYAGSTTGHHNTGLKQNHKFLVVRNFPCDEADESMHDHELENISEDEASRCARNFTHRKTKKKKLNGRGKYL
ncbi:hypothetical protein KP509_32G067100 [Ceratopteris richardii]|uniref:Uncharacterized protein n=1 Tax=Ceratopteris richardii TaxID=49495 RepID=A0A8T2QUR2_CERRI|nr:hypothetical protein KP509_32G067100 [Ceratopteris richardii]